MIEDFFKAAALLKTVPRQGWIEKTGIANPESVADHSYSASVISMVFGDMLGLDADKMVRMSLLHDLAETVTSDITPEKMEGHDKQELENKVMLGILSTLPAALQERYLGIWDEFSAGKSPESRLFHEIDKLEMAIQATAYSGQYPGRSFAPFVQSADSVIQTPELRKIFLSITGGMQTAVADKVLAKSGGAPEDGPVDKDVVIEVQRQVIGVLFEVIKRFQENNGLDDEYFKIISSGRAGTEQKRLDEITKKRKDNALVVDKLLSQLE
ncbi:HD superfamily hydrolase [Cenarchaeum symbiosum A]|uniref:5'-deoxynucleotidase n=1 Tax=Cenarchaeum symbiosum (strain A) TaxID=414004 RepID=A0RU59_CENSY|nr:HD superfamily hydrolase [Cenarchaeum symbiosum A]